MSINKPRITKRDFIELLIILLVFLTVYLTGSQAEILGRIQGVFLKTGIKNAQGLATEDITRADYRFLVRNTKGDTLNMVELKGKTVFLNIWATWCPPCIAEMPNIDALYQDYKDHDHVAFVMISKDQNFQKATQWIEKKEMDLPIYELLSPLPQLYETGYIPSTFVISPDEKIVVRSTGMANYNTKDFRRLLDQFNQSSMH